MPQSATVVALTPEEIKREKKRASDKNYYARNRDRVRETVRKYSLSADGRATRLAHRKRNRNRILAQQKQRLQRNPEAALAKQRAWRAANKEQYRARLREWRARNRERLQQYARVYQIKYREKNRERLRADSRERYMAIREKDIVRRSQRYFANRDAEKARTAKWARDHPEKCKGYARKYNLSHKDSKREYLRKYRTTPKGKAVMLNNVHRRRAQIVGATGAATTEEIKTLLSEATHCCYCQKPFTKKRFATLDHVIPLSKNGTHTLSNFAAACRSCNCWKSDKDLHVVAKELGLLFV